MKFYNTQKDLTRIVGGFALGAAFLYGANEVSPILEEILNVNMTYPIEIEDYLATGSYAVACLTGLWVLFDNYNKFIDYIADENGNIRFRK